MRIALALALIAGLASVSLAQPDGQPGSQPAQPAQPTQPKSQPGTPPATPVPTAQPLEPAAPQGKPVPDLPVIERKELEGGLIIEDMKIGDGYEVKPGDAVVAFYHGTLKSDGTEFDSAFRRGEPTAFSLDGVVEGWQKGVPGMKVGGIRRLTIPSQMAYGEAGRPPTIPPSSDLVFIIQLEDALHWTDISQGDGEEVTGQCVAAVAQTIKTPDGKTTVHEETRPYLWLPGETQFSPRDDAIQTAIKGMKVGGKRKIHLPKEMNPAMPVVSDRPTGVDVEIELELVQVRNLQPRQPR